MIFGELGEGAKGTLLPQQRKGRPGIAKLLGRPFAAGLKNVHRRKRLVVVGVEASDGLRDHRRIRAGRHAPRPSRQ